MRCHEGLGIGCSLGRSGIDAGFSFYEQLSQRVSEVGKDEVDACMTCPTVLVPSWTNNAKQALDPLLVAGAPGTVVSNRQRLRSWLGYPSQTNVKSKLLTRSWVRLFLFNVGYEG